MAALARVLARHDGQKAARIVAGWHHPYPVRWSAYSARMVSRAWVGVA